MMETKRDIDNQPAFARRRWRQMLIVVCLSSSFIHSLTPPQNPIQLMQEGEVQPSRRERVDGDEENTARNSSYLASSPFIYADMSESIKKHVGKQFAKRRRRAK